MLTLANRTYAETCNLLIPQCRVNLGELRNDAVFKKRLADELGLARDLNSRNWISVRCIQTYLVSSMKNSTPGSGGTADGCDQTSRQGTTCCRTYCTFSRNDS
jgi:hypothetical protein